MEFEIVGLKRDTIAGNGPVKPCTAFYVLTHKKIPRNTKGAKKAVSDGLSVGIPEQSHLYHFIP